MEKITQTAIQTLKNSQKRSGNIPGVTRIKGRKDKAQSTTFYSSLILEILSDVNQPELNLIKEKLALFLLSQKSDLWTYNWWVRGSEESKKDSYPDDIDDSVCALSSLQAFDKKIITGKTLAAITKILIAVEEKEGGPYGTWIVEGGNRDIDLAVNANVAYFLEKNDVVLEGLKKYLINSIDRGIYTSKYYTNDFTVMYFLSRLEKIPEARRKKLLSDLIRRIEKTQNISPLERLLILHTLIHLNAKKNTIVDEYKKVCEELERSGFLWSGFVIERVKNGESAISSTPALAAALFLKAKRVIDEKENKKVLPDPIILKKRREIKVQIAKDAESFGKELQSRFGKRLEKTLRDDLKNQQMSVSMMPFFSSRAFGFKVHDESLQSLSKVSIYGWIAYTIYDNFLDEEADPRDLPVANSCLRLLMKNLSAIGNDFFIYSERIIQKMEDANAWEVSNCRVNIKNSRINLKRSHIPDHKSFDVLADRSMGHSLSAIGVLFLSGFDEESVQVQNLFSYFKFVIIAKQLNDDAHDWEEDLRRGHLSSVCSLILKNYMVKNRLYKLDEDIEELIPKLHEQFWYEDIAEVCDHIFSHSDKAERCIRQIPEARDKSFFLKMIEVNRKSAQIALAERKKTVEFLKNFS